MSGSEYFQIDLSEGDASGLGGQYDCVLLAEVLEHVPRPIDLLAGARQLLAPGGHLCVTVPNALSARTAVRALGGREVVHPDHYCYYSPRTITRTLAEAGLMPHLIMSYLNIMTPTVRGRLFNVFARTAHSLTGAPIGEGLIAWSHPLPA